MSEASIGNAVGTDTAREGTPLPKDTREKQEEARKFAEWWKDKGESEIGETQKFWLSLMRNVFGVEEVDRLISFEKDVYISGNKKRIDGFITLSSIGNESRILIEQKNRDTDLNKAEKQSDGANLTPFEQGKRYADWLSNSEKPQWIVVCNFREFRVYDMNKPSKKLGQEYETVFLKDFERDWYRLEFLADAGKEVAKRQEAASRQTGELIGKLYKLMKSKARSDEELRCLNIFCVRLVFCFYAEDTGLFGDHTAFDDYVRKAPLNLIRDALARLFKWLDTLPEKRDERDNEAMKLFPYADGGLFAGNAGKEARIPYIDEEIKSMILECGAADWSGIDPVIFGSIFEGTLNPATRREGGMHYTSPRNIDKALDPLFMDELTAELERGKAVAGKKAKDAALHAFQDKIAGLKFLDPACGSGNFLTRAYTRLRSLENEAILSMSENADIAGGQAALGTDSLIKVSIGQFYGIEINDFAVSVAKTALWIAERQMLQATERILGEPLPFLPIKTQAHIFEGNALRLDWETMKYEDNTSAKEPLKNPDPKDKQMAFSFDDMESVESIEAMQRKLEEAKQELLQKQKEEVPHYRYDYIMGNPPFAGRRYRSQEQIKDVAQFFNYKDIDYVACWYKKAADFIQDTQTHCAFVSTNSITQGEQVVALWRPIFEKGIHIDFAYRTFRWDSESTEKAHVHCVIIGFSCAPNDKPKIIYEERVAQTAEGKKQSELVQLPASNINGYLSDAPNVFIDNRSVPLCDVPKMKNGNVPLDGDALKIEVSEIGEFKDCMQYVKRLMGGRELIHNEERYVLWLVGVAPDVIRKHSHIYNRVKLCRERRLAMKDAETRKLAATPTTFRDTNNPDSYIALPMVSSEKRQYLPMVYLDDSVIPTNQIQTIPSATLYHFGVLTSSVHMAWMRAVAGRLEMRYRYSKDIVYNNFVWSEATDKQKERVTQTAQAILDARAQFPDSSLADLYDELTMPPALRKAHTENDRAVLASYGWAEDMSEADIVANLMQMYHEKTRG